MNTLQAENIHVERQSTATGEALDALYAHLAAVRTYRASRLVRCGLPRDTIARELGADPAFIRSSQRGFGATSPKPNTE